MADTKQHEAERIALFAMSTKEACDAQEHDRQAVLYRDWMNKEIALAAACYKRAKHCDFAAEMLVALDNGRFTVTVGVQ